MAENLKIGPTVANRDATLTLAKMQEMIATAETLFADTPSSIFMRRDQVDSLVDLCGPKYERKGFSTFQFDGIEIRESALLPKDFIAVEYKDKVQFFNLAAGTAITMPKLDLSEWLDKSMKEFLYD